MVNMLALKLYLIDVFNLIDHLFMIALICFFVLWCFGIDIPTYKWGISIIGVLFWPDKQWWIEKLKV